MRLSCFGPGWLLRVLLRGIAVLAAGPVVAEIPDPVRVGWAGSLHAVHRGDHDSAITVNPLLAEPGLVAIGVGAGLDGEITVVDGEAHVAIVRFGRLAERDVDGSSATKAAFLAWAHVPEWGEATVLSSDIPDLATLDRIVAEHVTRAGLPTDEPVPFVIEGMVESVKFHVLSGPPRTAGADHRESAMNLHAGNVPARLVGFHSTRHAGVVTHRGSNTHAHVIEASGRSGHVDAVAIAAGARLRVPVGPIVRE